MTELPMRTIATGVAALAMVVVGCSGGADRPASRAVPRRAAGTTGSPAPSSAPPSSPPPAPSTAGTPPAPRRLEEPVTVVRVVDGDTVRVSTGETLRLIGVDTPETVDPRAPVQCFGREASARAHALLDGAWVRLEYDPTQGRRDRYGRTLAYLWLADGRLYNETIIAEGYAHEYTYAIPYRYRDRFRAAERAARDAGRGLWSPTTCAGDTARAADAATPPPAAAGCDPSYVGVCIPPAPPDLDCADIPYRRFQVVGADPHRFDGERDGVGCE
jgi:micrococcal nuclease